MKELLDEVLSLLDKGEEAEFLRILSPLNSTQGWSTCIVWNHRDGAIDGNCEEGPDLEDCLKRQLAYLKFMEQD